MDYYLGWHQKDNASLIKIGFLARLSKVILLNQQFILEPEICFGSIQTLDEAGLGIDLAGKYRF